MKYAPHPYPLPAGGERVARESSASGRGGRRTPGCPEFSEHMIAVLSCSPIELQPELDLALRICSAQDIAVSRIAKVAVRRAKYRNVS